MGKSPPKEFLKEIEKICLRNKNVISVHKIRAQEIGNHVYLDFHLTFDEKISLKKANEICIDVQKRIFDKFDNIKDIMVYIHPQSKKCELRRFWA